MTQEELKALAQELKSLVKELIISESQGVEELRKVTDISNVFSLPAIERIGDQESIVEVALTSLVGGTGKTPVLSFAISSLPFGSDPTISSSGTDETPHIAIGFPISQNGDSPVWKKTVSGIDIKYSREPESAYTPLFLFADVMPDVSDFSPEGILLLQQPATEAAAEVRQQMVQLSQDVNQTRDKLVEDAGKVNADLTAAVGALEERAGTVISETNTVKESAETAVTNAKNATKAATDAADLANTAAEDTNKATELAVVAAKLADKKAELASTSAGNANTAAGLAADAAALAGEKAALATTAAGVADTATGKANTASTNADTATKRANDAAAAAEGIISGVRPNWEVDDPTLSSYIANKPEIPTLDVVPGSDTLNYINSAGSIISFRVGDEVRALEDGEYVFYKLYDLSGGVASWSEAGSGTALPGNIYLQGATYYNESVRIIKGGYLNEE